MCQAVQALDGLSGGVAGGLLHGIGLEEEPHFEHLTHVSQIQRRDPIPLARSKLDEPVGH